MIRSAIGKGGDEVPRPSRRTVLKSFLVVFLPFFVNLTLLLLGIYSLRANAEKTLVEENTRSNVAVQREGIYGDLKTIVSDLLFLAEHHDVKEVFGDGAARRAAKEDLAVELASFSGKKGIYDQVRLLDTAGMEVVRINYRGGSPRSVPERELQSKANRYYFRYALRLHPGEVYVSPFDLNVERSVVERPLKPIVRFATPVRDKGGEKRGIFILNYLGQGLIDGVRKRAASAPGHTMLLNSDGFWLIGASSEDEWGFILPQRSDKAFGRLYPRAWEKISNSNSGQFYLDKGLFTFETVNLENLGSPSVSGRKGLAPSSKQTYAASRPFWKIVSHVSNEILHDNILEFKHYLLIVYAVVSCVSFVGCLIFARMRVSYSHREGSLREAGVALERRRLFEVGTEATRRRFSVEELSQFNGLGGWPAYIAFGGVVYDVSSSNLWRNGRHAGLHAAGCDLSESLNRAPHGEEAFNGLPVMGELRAEPAGMGNILQGIVKLRLHSILVHFSIAYTFLIPFLAGLFLLNGNVAFEIASFYLLGLGIVTTFFAGVSGLLSWWVTYRGSPTRIFALKTLLTVFIFAVMAICLVWRFLDPQVLVSRTFFSYVYLALLMSEVPLAAILGHLGGKIVYA